MRRLLYVLVVFALPGAAYAAAPTLGAHFAKVDNSGTSAVLSATGLTGGRTLVCPYLQSNTGSRTYTATDDQGNTYNAITRTTANVSDAAAGLLYATGIVVSGGNLTITAAQAGGAAVAFSFTCVEMTAATLDGSVFGAKKDGSSGTSHDCVATGLTSSADVFVYCASVCSGSAGTRTPTSSPAFQSTLLADMGTGQFAQYYSGTTALSSNVLNWTSTGSPVQCYSAAASFVTPAAGSARPPTSLLLGVG